MGSVSTEASGALRTQHNGRADIYILSMNDKSWRGETFWDLLTMQFHVITLIFINFVLQGRVQEPI